MKRPFALLDADTQGTLVFRHLAGEGHPDPSPALVEATDAVFRTMPGQVLVEHAQRLGVEFELDMGDVPHSHLD